MIKTLAIANYRSLLKLTVPLGRLNLITGANGSGKSNLYRALRLLTETAQGGVVRALAHEGGLGSTYWAGPEEITKRMRDGDVRIQGGPRKRAVRLHLGFSGEDFGYAISLGLPEQTPSVFSLDPEIKRECIWAGPHYRPASLLVDRKGSTVRVRSDPGWDVVAERLGSFDSMFSHGSGTSLTPEAFHMRETLRGWRFYDHFRTDKDAPARAPQLGTRTPVLHHDGHDVAAALQTIREVGDGEALDEAISDAFPGASLDIAIHDTRFSVEFQQQGLLRSLTGAELSDGTLRYLLWVAALLTPRPPSVMVLNEPETSLSPDLLPALARLIVRASENAQVWVVSHADRLIAALREHRACQSIELTKDLGETQIVDQGFLDVPLWHWPD
jgi:predicted ATPase